jgi:hypothetical protein
MQAPELELAPELERELEPGWWFSLLPPVLAPEQVQASADEMVAPPQQPLPCLARRSHAPRCPADVRMQPRRPSRHPTLHTTSASP